MTLSLFSCSLYESEGRKEFREKGEGFQLSSLGTVDNCFVTSDSISQSHTEIIDEELSILETQTHDYYFVSQVEPYTIVCEKFENESLSTYFYERYESDQDHFWSWANAIAHNPVLPTGER